MHKRYDIIRNEADDSARVYLYGPIGADYFDGVDAAEFVQRLDSISAQELEIRINSPGGSVFDGIAIAEAIERHNATKKHVHVDGLAASIATRIALAGEKIHMAKNGRWMIHNAFVSIFSWFEMTADEIDDYAEKLKKTADDLRGINDDLVVEYVEATDGDEKQIRKWMDEETFFSAEEALEAGFIHEVTKKARVASAKWDREAYTQHIAACVRSRYEIPEPSPDEETPLRDKWRQHLTNRTKT